MKTYECIARSGNTGNEIVLFIRAYTPQSAHAEAIKQAKLQFGPGAGAIFVPSVKEV